MSKILFIGGSLNQTTQMHQIARQLDDHHCFFTPFYVDGIEDFAARQGWLETTALGGRHWQETNQYLRDHHLPLDHRGMMHHYDLVVTCSDLVVQKNILGKRIILVQEGITLPEGFAYHLTRTFKFLPRYLANTASFGLSGSYDLFCVASEGYRDLFINKGIHPEKIAVTGIPNFDNLQENLMNSFPHHNYVLIATTPYRENLRYEDRMAFLRKCASIARDREVIVKLHPMEKIERASSEIVKVFPNALIFSSGSIHPMIANAEIVITQQSTCTYTALALGKQTYSELDLQELSRLMPLQNNGDSARRIAKLCNKVLITPMPVIRTMRLALKSHPSKAAPVKQRVRNHWEASLLD